MIEDLEQVERDLRRLLMPVELVCEADIPQDLIDAAEAGILPLIRSDQYRTVTRLFPATYVTYLVCCGAERYARNRFWPQVGVVGNSSDAGRSFLASLDSLSLPDFETFVEQAGARRYVAPILIHGALPSSVASRLVERVEQELRRGLVSGAEARSRMLRDPDIELTLRRPATRLLQWCPEYADRLLDALIDHIENPGGAGLSRLPTHLQQALLTNANRRQGLRRLVMPTIDFQMWSGFGPEVVGAPSLRWSIEFGGNVVHLAHDERVEVPPNSDVIASLGGRRLPLLAAQDVLFFDHSGRPVPADAQLPTSFVAVLPRNWSLRTPDGERLPEDDEGVPLTGSWSRHRSCGLTIVDRSLVCAGPTDEPDNHRIRRSVTERTEASLVGAVVTEATSTFGGAVYSATPTVAAPGATSESLGAWFTPVGAAMRYITLERVGSTYELSDLGAGALAGSLQLRSGGSIRGATLPFAVVPGLEIVVPTIPLGPHDISTITAIADEGVLVAEGDLVVGAAEAEVHLEVVGLPPGSVSVALPRVQWSLRSERLARLDLASGTIAIEHADLVKEPLWLNVRCGHSSNVAAQLVVSGVDAQRIQSKPTKATGPSEHHRSIALDELRDTLRAHPDEPIDVVVVVDGYRFTAVTCEGTTAAPLARAWRAPTPQPELENKWRKVPWLRDLSDAGGRSTDLERRLRQLGGDDAVVLFLRIVGQQQQSWKLTEFPHGASGREWLELMEAANALWRIDGVRLRDFTGVLEERLRQWSRSRRETLRKAPELHRQAIEAWLLGRVPPVARLTTWEHREWLEMALPPKSAVSCQWLPATIIYHCVALLTGQEDSGPVIASAIDLEPALVLEVLAFLMQVLHGGRRIRPPVIDESADEQEPAEAESELEAAVLPMLAVSECAIDVNSASSIYITAPRASSVPMFRLSRSGKPVALLAGTADDLRITLSRPIDVDGVVQLSIVTGDELGAIEEAIDIHLPASAQLPTPRSVLVSDPARLNDARLDSLLDQITVIAHAGGIGPKLVEELFEDERDAAQALVRLSHRCGPNPAIDEVGIAVLPTAMLFSDLGVTLAQGGAVDDRVVFAALAPRDPAGWRKVGWPNPSHFDAGSRPLDDLFGFAMKLARKHAQLELPTKRYASSREYPNFQIVNSWVHQMARSVPRAAFLDLIVATHRMLTVDALVDEAMRTLLLAHVREPAATSDAVVAGVALFLATHATGKTH